MSYFIWASNKKPTVRQTAEIRRRVREILHDVSFSGRLDIPGNDTGCWLERPNDGTNDYGFRREQLDKIRDVANEVLGITSVCVED